MLSNRFEVRLCKGDSIGRVWKEEEESEERYHGGMRLFM